MARVLVTDGSSRSALAVVRSLGRAGHAVFVVADRLPALASVSRFVTGTAVIPDVRRGPREAVEALAAQAHAWNADLVLPMTDATLTGLWQCIRGRELGGARIVAAEAAQFAAVADKDALLGRAQQIGIGVPAGMVVEDAAGLAVAMAQFGPEVVLKPSRSVIPHQGRLLSFGAVVARADAPPPVPYPPKAFPILVQERVAGSGEGAFVLARAGEVQVMFAHRRIREKPPWGGVSTYRESIPLPPDLLAATSALVADLGWNGVAMAEFKRTPAGEAVLLEVNGRFWGSLQLAIDAGVDFPRLLVAQALGQDVAPPLAYQAGVRSRWEWGDLDQLITQLRGRGPARPGLRGRLAALGSFLRVRRGERWEVWDLRDPAPFWRESLDWLRAAR